MAATSTRGDDFASRWDSQQERYLHREERFALMLDFVAAAVEGSNLRLLDLCWGAGSISKRALGRFPDASIVAVDNDPALLELGRRALGDRVEWRDADLRNQHWADDLDDASFDAILSATAIHWFQPNEVVAMYQTLARLLRRGGVLIAKAGGGVVEGYPQDNAGQEDFRHVSLQHHAQPL
jgi:trans-aconitate methyltransferase